MDKTETASAQHHDRQEAGFTLLELTIALSILSLIVVMAGAAMRLSVQSVEKGEGAITSIERVRTSVRVIQSQVQSFVPITKRNLQKIVFDFLAEPASFSFYSAISVWGRDASVQSVTYDVIRNENGHSLLVTEKDRFRNFVRSTYLFANLNTISFKYFVRSPASKEGTWMDSVEDKDNIPEQVLVRLVGRDLQEDLVIPVRTQSSNLNNPFISIGNPFQVP